MLKTQLKQALAAATQALYPEHADRKIVIEYPANPDHGDYSCNIAMQLVKAVGKPPREIAQTFIETLEQDGALDFIDRMEIAGPGFLNFYVKGTALVDNLSEILKRGDAYGTNDQGSGKKVIIEYSSPNTNKPLHLGHARNNALGMAVSNLLEANGYEVMRTQIINDRGIHICKSMVAYRRYGDGATPESEGMKGDHFVGKYYVKYAQIEKEDASIEDEAKTCLKQWEDGDPEVRELWTTMNTWVLGGFDQTYERLGSTFDFETFESEISEEGRAIVEKAFKEGKVEKIEGGALAIDLSDCGLGDSETGRKVLVRSNGTTIYMTQDLQLAVKRVADTDVDELIYVVGNEQDYHFKVLFEVLKRFGYEWAERCYHLSYGMVNLPSGKLKSREGKTVDIDSLVDELEGMVDQELVARNMEYEGDERRELISTVALGALKYYLLKVDAKSILLYDPASSIAFQGDTGPYLQYTHARLHSILRKAAQANERPSSDDTLDASHLSTPEEMALLRALQLYPEVVHSAAREHRIHTLANALFDLAQATNSFYAKHPVLEGEGLTPEIRTARLHLITAVTQVLKNGLAILGIRAPERM